jgi:O-antigen ligase
LRWAAYALLSAAFSAAVLLQGGVHPRQWQWSALAISIAASFWTLAGPVQGRAPMSRWDQLGFALMTALAAWMVLPLIPLPLTLLRQISPQRWNAIVAAARLTGANPTAWAQLSFAPLSFAPPATFERLLDVLPALAAFAAAREMGWWWRTRMWIAIAPVIAIAWCESLLGCAQFYLMRLAGGEAASATGTYVNRNHFAGLLEMALPLAVMAAFAVSRRVTRRSSPDRDESIRPWLSVAALAGIAACLLVGIVASLSRMGFISTAVALGATLLALAGSRTSGDESGASRPWLRGGRWIIPLVAPLLILLLTPTRELTQRFAFAASTEEVGLDTRIAIWKDTAHLIADHKWIGSGIGAYERGLYLYKTVKPTHTLDFAHNDYLQIVAELGIPGALLAAGLGAWILWRCLAVAVWRRGSRNWELSLGLLGAIAAIALHSLTDFNLYIPANALALAWICGLAVSPGLKGSLGKS